MPGNLTSKGSGWQRIQSVSLTLLLSLLLIWFFGFLRYDVSDLDGPDRQSFYDSRDQGPQDLLDDLLSQKLEVTRELQRNRNLQKDYKASKENSREVMEEISSLHRLSIEQGHKPPEEDVLALANARTRFLSAQEKLEVANIAVTESNSREFELTDDIRRQRELIRVHNIPAIKEYNDAYESHRVRVAFYKLGIPLPLFLLAAWLVRRHRKSHYRPIFFAFLTATFWEVGVIAFEHYPMQYFKYIAIGVAILIVGLFLKYTLKNLSAPPKDLLLRRYRESYEKCRCPRCDFPIRRGHFRDVVWGKKGPTLPMVTGSAQQAERPYTCPSCGTGLFGECDSCQEMTHTLLPNCENCGVETPVESLQ
ncbi:MAG: zinc ribbon domain-containing protein [Planctomycetota bacterium]|nr:zinc ribbon domain-containing protein [Planctomycetota bacterium]